MSKHSKSGNSKPSKNHDHSPKHHHDHGHKHDDSHTPKTPVPASNHQPWANDDVYQVNSNSQLHILASGILGNDGDNDGDPLSIIEINGGAAGLGQIITLASGAKLKLNADGSFDYDPNGKFNAVPAGSNGTDSFTYKISDGKGGYADAVVSIKVAGIGAAPSAIGNETVQLDDDSLSGGNPGGVGDDLNTINLTGTLSHSYGADGAGTTLFLATGAPAGFTYTLYDGGRTIYVKQISTGLDVFKIVLTDAGSGAYKVTQMKPIDHPPGGDENNITFNVSYKVADLHGHSATGLLAVNVDDDTPTIADNCIVRLDDNSLSGGNPGGVGDDSNTVNLTGTLSHSYGADGPGTTLFTAWGAPAGFTYTVYDGGKTIYVKQISTGLNVFKIDLSDATCGDYRVTQLNPIDHPPGHDENNLCFDIRYEVRDHDGDSATGCLTVDVDDDTPVVGDSCIVRLDDDSLSGGNPGGIGDDPNTVNLTGTLSHSYGADGPGTTLFLGGGAPSGFTYTIFDGGKTIYVKQISTGLNVFKIDLSDATCGDYKVTQLNPIDHPPGHDENNLCFDIRYEVRDHDGDCATGCLTVDVDDDTPVVGDNCIVRLDDNSLSGGNPGGIGDDPNTVNLNGDPVAQLRRRRPRQHPLPRQRRSFRLHLLDLRRRQDDLRQADLDRPLRLQDRADRHNLR